jgi:hypothetical protein
MKSDDFIEKSIPILCKDCSGQMMGVYVDDNLDANYGSGDLKPLYYYCAVCGTMKKFIKGYSE